MDYRRVRKIEENIWRIDHRRSTVLTVGLRRNGVRYQQTIKLNEFPRGTKTRALTAALRRARRLLRAWTTQYGPRRHGPQDGLLIGGPVVAASGVRGVHGRKGAWSAVWYEDGRKHRVYCGQGIAGLAKATRLRHAAERRLRSAAKARAMATDRTKR